MPIIFDCECGKKLKARDDLAGQWVDCPACGRGLLVPLADSASTPAEVAIKEEAPARSPSPPAYPPAWRPPDYAAARYAQPVIAAPSPQLERAESSWRGFVYWVLLLAV